MAYNTENLDLLVKDPIADSDQTFNLQTMINDNLVKIDQHAGAVNTQLAQTATNLSGKASTSALTSHTDSQSAHGATSEKAVNKIMSRDVNGDTAVRVLNCQASAICVNRQQSIAQIGSLYDTFTDFAGNLIGVVGFGSGGSFDFFVNNASANANIKLVTTAGGRIIITRGSAEVAVITGAGSPEGSITAPIGSLYLRTDGGAGTSFYVKQSGSGNVGWTAK